MPYSVETQMSMLDLENVMKRWKWHQHQKEEEQTVEFCTHCEAETEILGRRLAAALQSHGRLVLRRW